MLVDMASDLDITLADVQSWLPPVNVADDCFAWTDLGQSASSIEGKLFMLTHPGFEEWCQSAVGWKGIECTLGVVKNQV